MHAIGLGSVTGSPLSANPLLGNGGPTQTIAPATGSPATGSPVIDARGGCPPTDQRGLSRPDHGETAGDIGAVEVQDPPGGGGGGGRGSGPPLRSETLSPTTFAAAPSGASANDGPAPRYTRLLTLRGSFTLRGRRGANVLRFTGRLRGRKLPPGRDRLLATLSADHPEQHRIRRIAQAPGAGAAVGVRTAASIGTTSAARLSRSSPVRRRLVGARSARCSGLRRPSRSVRTPRAVCTHCAYPRDLPTRFGERRSRYTASP